MYSQNTILSLVRLLRFSAGNLSYDTQRLVLSALHTACKEHKLPVNMVRLIDVSSSHNPKGAAYASKNIAAQPTQPHPIKEKKQPTELIQEQAKQSFSARLQQMIHQQASWPEIQELLKKWWCYKPSAKLACKMVELGYVWSGPSGVEDVLPCFEDVSFWLTLHPMIRKHLILHLYKRSSMDLLMTYLKKEAFSQNLYDYERFAVFIWAMGKKEYGFLFRLHTQYFRELLKCAKERGEPFSFPEGEFRYSVGIIRIEQGHFQAALDAIKPILPSDPAYAAACKLRRRIQTEKKNASHSHLHAKIIADVVSKSDWQSRENTLRHYFEKVRRNDGSQALISVLGDLLVKKHIIPMERPGMLSRYVGMCLEYFDLYETIPNIMHILTSNSCVFHPVSIDGAIWNHFLGEDIPDFPCDPWRAVAHFHRFMMLGIEAAQDLRQSYELFSGTWQVGDYVMDLSFAALKKAALIHLKDNRSHHDMFMVKRMVAAIELCAEDAMIETSSIEDYLEYVKNPPYNTLKRLLKIATSRRQTTLISKVLETFLEKGFLRNRELKLTLMDAIQRQQYDMAWRLITVLKSRTITYPILKEVWKVSGENRQNYGITDVTSHSILQCLAVSAEEKAFKMLTALITCGHKIPELIALASYKAEVMRWRNPPSGSLEEIVAEDLSYHSWLKRPPRRVTEGQGHGYSALPIPESTSLVLTRYAVCVSYIFEYLGIMVLRGDLLKLIPLIPMTTGAESGGSYYNPTKKATQKWLRSLNETERMAWLDICGLLREATSYDLSREVGKLVFSLALLVLPNHHLALSTIQRLAMPLEYLRNMERFILSQSYDNFRKTHQLASKVPVPAYASLLKELQNKTLPST